ncbi:uncharacterized protein LOC142068195 isoform X3 [Phalacrocorax aristotelis]|uniref:uncharacterized protein LOC142068195 isoform X3 n=1 Tax=Phalacrocorax aristotelis TaxID=126867 RepID=UPI003F4C9531
MSSVGPRCAGSQSPAGPLLQHAREDFSGTVTAKLPLTAQRFLAQELELFSLARASEKALLHLQSHPGATQELKFHKNNHFAPPPSHQPLHPHPAGPRGGGEGGTEVLKWSLHLLPRLHAGTATCRFWLSDSAPGVRPGPDRGTGLLRAQVTQTQYIGALAASKSGQFA